MSKKSLNLFFFYPPLVPSRYSVSVPNAAVELCRGQCYWKDVFLTLVQDKIKVTNFTM